MFPPRNYSKCAERPNKTGFNLIYEAKVAAVLSGGNSNYVAKKSNFVALLGKLGRFGVGLERMGKGRN